MKKKIKYLQANLITGVFSEMIYPPSTNKWYAYTKNSKNKNIYFHEDGKMRRSTYQNGKYTGYFLDFNKLKEVANKYGYRVRKPK